MNLENKHGTNPKYVSSLPSKISLLLGSGWLSSRLRALGSHLASPLTPTPVIDPSKEPWAAKNAGFMAQTLMLAATAHGLRTLPMEGYDERRLAYVLGIDLEYYTIPLCVVVGHSAEAGDRLRELASGNLSEVNPSIDKYPTKVRFPVSDVAYSDKFGGPLQL
jgi:nitroreductase